MSNKTVSHTIWHVGGEDVHMRIPLLKKLSERGYKVGAVGTSDTRKFEGTGIDYYTIPLSRWVNPFSDIRTLIALRKLIRQHKPDIVHGFDTKPSILAPMAVGAAHCQTQSVRTINGMGYLYSETNLLTTLLKPLYEIAQRVVGRVVGFTIFQNSTDKQFFEDKRLVQARKCNLISGSGVSESLVDPAVIAAQMQSASAEFAVDGRKVVTMVARLVKNKGVVEFLQAARRIRQQRKDVIFLLVGPFASEGSQAVEKAVLDQYCDDVIVTGPRDDVPALLLLTSVFVLPTNYREGVPRSLLEAALAGLPLVATEMPGCVDVVRHGDNGLLIEPRNASALAEATNTILDALPAWQARARNRQEEISATFGIETVSHKHDAVYQALLKQT